ncbi:MAG: methyltransferase [Acidimicrobiales bacterium]|nr:methyltransferase [Acidimicrobiales bacterium]
MSPGHYFDPDPTARSRIREVALVLPDLSCHLQTDSGVFSADRVDPGTKLLLLEGPEPDAGHGPLLDLGCGYGPIAITLAHRCPDATVWAVDVNQRARDLCRRNAELQGVADRVLVASPDDVDPDLVFGQIWSNPPIRIGKQAVHDMLSSWLARMHPQGGAHLVVSRHLGADSLARWLSEAGFEVTRRRSRMGYRLLDVAPRVGHRD